LRWENRREERMNEMDRDKGMRKREDRKI